MVSSRVIISRIEDTLKKNPQGMNVIQIARETRINRNTVGRYLENLLVSGEVEMRRFGMEKIYGLAQRVPLSNLLSISSSLVVQMDSNLRIIYANEPFLELIGTDSKNLLGKNIEYTPVAMVFDEIFKGFIENIKEGVTGKEWTGEFVLGTKDIDLFCRIAPTVFNYGRKGVTVILEDITARKHAEDALRESEATTRALMNAPSDSVILIDTNGIILALNEIAASRLGKRADELVGVLADDLLPKELARTRRTLMIPVLEKKEMVRYEDERNGAWYDTVAYPIVRESGEVERVVIISRDITERKRSERELQESEDRYRTLVEISPDAVFLHQEGNIIYANPASIGLLGASHPDEIIGKNVLEFIQPEFRIAVRKNIEKDLSGEITLPMELPMFRIDGTPVLVEGRGVKTTIHGKPAIQVALTDITERKHREDELQESEKRLRLILDSTDDLVIMQDAEGRYLYFNPAARYGVSVEEMIGLTPHDFLDRMTADLLVERVKNVVKTGQRIRQETPIEWKGQTLWFSDSLSPVKDEQGTITAVVTVSQNITERKHAENALRESEEKYRNLVNRANDIICVVQDGIVKMRNARLAELWGGSDQEITGRSFADFIHPDALPDIMDKHNRRISGESFPSVYETIFQKKDGSRSVVELNAGIISYEGRPADLVIVRDINDRKKAEEALIRSERRFRTLITAIGDIAWETDAEARFVYVSQQVETTLGYRPDELIGHTPFEFLRHDTIQPNRIKFRTALENHEKFILHTSNWIHKDGHEVILESNAIPKFDGNGSFSGFIGMDRKR
jgi:PAS domain S-box-containing protein